MRGRSDATAKREEPCRRRLGARARAAIASALIGAFVAAAAPSAIAQTTANNPQVAALEKGRQLYAAGKHFDTDLFFKAAIEGNAPTITDPSLVAQGRMLRGASDMYLGKKADAVAQFELILKIDPKFEPDPIAFPPGVLDEFRKTRDRLAKEAASNAANDAAAKEIAGLRAQLSILSNRFGGLRLYAMEEDVVVKRSRVVATIPFGVGQFQNGDTALGVILAASQGVTLASAVIAFGIHASIPTGPVADPGRRDTIEKASRYINIVTVGAFAALAIGGVIQAHLAFVPESHETRAKPLPEPFSAEPILAPTKDGGIVGLAISF